MKWNSKYDQYLGGNNHCISSSTLLPRISFDLQVTVQSPWISKVFFIAHLTDTGLRDNFINERLNRMTAKP